MRVDVLPGARIDIAALKRADPAALAVILGVLQEAEGEVDQELISKLTSRRDIDLGAHRLNVKPWAQARRSDNLFRFRVLDTPATNYRVIYGYDWRQRHIGLLAILRKENFDYELDSDIADRIVRDWRIATEGQST